MNDTQKRKSLIFDFDSTFVKIETIDLLAELSLKDDSNAKEKISQISEITKKAMAGEIDFPTALEQRLSILSLNSNIVFEITNEISNQVTDSFKRNKELIKSLSDDIWIVSGGFSEIICPIVNEYGISDNHVIANSFIYDGNLIIGCDRNNFLFQNKGKTKAIKSLGITNLIIMIGDGFTDLEVYLNGAANQFICFTENIERRRVVKESELVASDFEGIMKLLNNI